MQKQQQSWESTYNRFYALIKVQIVSKMFVRCASDRRGTLLSINRSTDGEKYRGCLKKVRKTSVNTVLHESASGSL